MIYKSSRHPSIKKDNGYNRYDGKADGRNMINDVPCVKFNMGVALDELICKANHMVYISKVAPTSDKNKHRSHNAMLVTTCVVGARMARSW